MVIDLPKNKNIVVLSTYRVGSTAFCNLISKQYSLVNFNEFFHPIYHREQKLSQRKWIVKIMPDHFDHPDVQRVLEDSFKIGISRKDVIAQITSFYICHMTGRWHQIKGTNPHPSYDVQIDLEELENQIRYILNMNVVHSNLTARYCQTQYYFEDIKDQLNDSKFDAYCKPSNYNQIYQSVSDWISNR